MNESSALARFWRLISAITALSLALMLLAEPQLAAAQSFKVLYTFTGGSDGQYSFGNLVRFAGSFYGTTKQGGNSDNGVVFRITP